MLPETEPRISLKSAGDDPRMACDGRAPHFSSIYRWYLTGARSRRGKRVRLEVEKGPRGVVTSVGAIGRFLAALNDDDGAAPQSAGVNLAPRRPSGSAAKQLAAAELDTIGI